MNNNNQPATPPTAENPAYTPAPWPAFSIGIISHVDYMRAKACVDYCGDVPSEELITLTEQGITMMHLGEDLLRAETGRIAALLEAERLKERVELILQRAELTLKALSESVKLQSHYAKQLNMSDGGQRQTFEDAKDWISRLQQTGILAAPQPQAEPAGTAKV